VSTGKRAANAADGKISAAKRAKFERLIMNAGACSKSTLAKVLHSSHEQGLLANGMVDGSVDKTRKSLGVAAAGLGKQETPFGRVIQHMTLNTSPPFTWPFIHPVALLCSLSKASPSSAAMMDKCIDGARPMDIVVSVDKARPGNVLRPYKGRATQAFCWAFAQWPEWYSCRSDAWLPFGFLRSGAIGGCQGASHR